MASVVLTDEVRLSDQGGPLSTGSDDAPSDRLLCVALRVLATLGLLPVLLVLVAVTAVAIPLCRLVAACEGARSNPLPERTAPPDGFGPRR